MHKTEILNEITANYINSADFNGTPYENLLREYKDFDESDLKSAIIDLIKGERISLNYTVNPFIKQYYNFPVTQQISVLNDRSIKQICLYPTEAHLNDVFKGTKHSDKPFANMLYFGKPQLEPIFFDMKVLEDYDDGSRYHINVMSDYSGSIAYNLKDQCEKDKILLPLFQFGYKKNNKETVVAACLRNLNTLPAEHQNKWMSYLLANDECQIVGGDYQSSIFGEWAESPSIYKAFIEELFHINELTLKIFGVKFFKDDFRKSRPEGFNPLFVPNEKNFICFLRVMDSMMDKNINTDFFAEAQLADRSAVQLLDAWLKEKVHLPTDEDYQVFTSPFRKISDIEQKAAAGNSNYDQRYIDEQNSLMRESYGAIKSLRVLFAGHPMAKNYRVPDWLDKDDLIII